MPRLNRAGLRLGLDQLAGGSAASAGRASFPARVALIGRMRWRWATSSYSARGLPLSPTHRRRNRDSNRWSPVSRRDSRRVELF
jgi:hypothetical protein